VDPLPPADASTAVVGVLSSAMPLGVRKERLRRRQRRWAAQATTADAPLSIRLCSLCGTCYYGNVILAAAIGGIIAGSSGHSFMACARAHSWLTYS